MRKILVISLLPLWLWGNDVFKENLYKSLGVAVGWYQYNEPTIMSIDAPRLSFIGNLGYAMGGGKLEGIFEVSYAIGIYTGSILDTDNPDRDGQPVQSLDGVFTGNLDLKAGYDLLKPFYQNNAKLYFQSGIGYFLNRNEFMAANRLQGYLYVPLELEGEIKIPSPNAPTALNFLLGYRYLILGNHFTAASDYGFTDDYHVIQKKGFGINALLGITFLENSHRRGVYLVYEYWNIGAADPMETSSVTGGKTSIYEPKNNSHILRLQFSMGF